MDKRAEAAARPDPPPAKPQRIADVVVTFRMPQDDDAARPIEAAVLERLRERSRDLEELGSAEAERILGPGARVEVVEVEPTRSVEVVLAIVAAIVQSPLLPQALDALARALERVARDVTGPVPFVLTSQAYWVPGPLLLAAPSPPAAPADDEDSDGGVSKWLLGSGAFLTATLALIGVTGADLDPVRINHSTQVSLAVAAIIVATLIGVIMPAWRKASRGSRIALTAILALVGVAVAAIVSLSNSSLAAKARPRIEAVINDDKSGALRLTADVKASGLKNTEHIFVRVVGVRERTGGPRRELLSTSRTGADNKGEVAMKLDLPIPAGVYDTLDVDADTKATQGQERDCDRDGETQIGCMRLAVPQTARRPRIAASWKVPLGTPPVLAVHAQMSGVTPRDRVLLSVRRRKVDGGLGGRLYAATWAPGADGIVDERVDITVDPARRPVCVIMRTLSGRSGIPSAGGGAYGPCHARRHGVSVYVGPPPATVKRT